MNLKKNYIALAFLFAAGFVSPLAVAATPLTCEVLEERRNSSIESKKDRIDELPEYEVQYEEIEAKNECMADLGEIMSAHVGASNVLGQISDFLGDKLSNQACEAAKKKAKEAKNKAQQKVEGKIKEEVGGMASKASNAVNQAQAAPAAPMNVSNSTSTPSYSNEQAGQDHLSNIYDKLGSLF